MYNEDDILTKFKHSFSGFSNKKIVIYGKGILAKLIIENFCDYNIIGILDGFISTGEFYGKSVLSLEKLDDFLPDMIIIAGQDKTIPIVYERIGELCFSKNIPVYDIYGRDLHIEFGYVKYINNEYIKNQILSHDIISFDIFDTLLVRKVLFPDDIFEIMEDKLLDSGFIISDFKKYRKQADEQNPIFIPTIHEIYNELQKLLLLTDEARESIKEIEIDLEKSALIARKSVVKLFDFAVENGKKVYLISDMYLPPDIIEKFLNELGIQGYNSIWVSCMFKENKNGELFRLYKEDVACVKDKATFLHIGDNLYSDVFSARKNNMDAILLKSSFSLFEMSSYCGLYGKVKNINERTMLGLFIARVFNSPFSLFKRYTRPTVDSLENIAYLFAAPYIATFVIWLLEFQNKQEYDELLFAARDGFLIHRLYQNALNKWDLKLLPRGIYLPTSRSLCTKASLESVADILWLAHRTYSGEAEEMLTERFGVPKAQVRVYDTDKYKNIDEYILSHKEIILAESKKIKEQYLAYMQDLKLEGNRKYAFVDMVSSGTSQGFLAKIVPFNLEGLYFCHYNSRNDYDNRLSDMKISSLYENDQTFYLYIWLEVVITAFTPSLNSIDSSGNFLYTEEIRTNVELAKIADMQKSIVEYFEDYTNLYVKNLGISPMIPEQIFLFMGPDFTREQSGLYEQFFLKDDFEKNKIILTQKYWRVNRSILHREYVKDGIVLSDPEQWEYDLKNYLLQYPSNCYEQVLMEDTRWEIFYYLSPMRTSLFNWYDFKKDSVLLEVGGGFGALTGEFCNKCKTVITIEKSLFRAECINIRHGNRDNLDIYAGDITDMILDEKFDYIVLIDELETAKNGSKDLTNYSDYLMRFKYMLKENGKILLATDNRYGIRYFCGEIEPHTGKPFSGINKYPQGANGYSFSRNELIKIVTQAGFEKYKFFYPLPDFKLTQLVYSDEYLPSVNLNERLFSYHVKTETLVALESNLYKDIIENNVFPFFSNSFLVECSTGGELSNAIYAAVTTDRGNENALSTVIFNNKTVKKKSLFSAGQMTIRRVYQNVQDLKARGVNVIQHELNSEELVMPYVQEEMLSDYLRYVGISEPQKFRKTIDDLYACILKSSETVSPDLNEMLANRACSIDFGPILKCAYIDMIPLNCFFICEEMYFFDQEFVRFNYPAKYVLFRALKYIYLFTPEIENKVPLKELKEKYGLTAIWAEFIEEENRFIAENRNYDIYNNFYKWVWFDENICFRNADKLQ